MTTELSDEQKIDRELTQEAQKKIEIEVEKQIETRLSKAIYKRLAAIAIALGLTGVGAAWYIVTSLNKELVTIKESMAGDIATEVTTGINLALVASNARIDEIVEKANGVETQADQLTGMLNNQQSSIATIETGIANANSDMAALLSSENLTEAAQLVRALGDNTNAQSLINSFVSAQDGLFGDCQPRVFVGRTDIESTKWEMYTEVHRNTATTTVDTSDANFTNTPLYFVSLGGSSTWRVTGQNAIYSPDKDSFVINLWQDAPEDVAVPLIDIANGKSNWYLTWMGVGCTN